MGQRPKRRKSKDNPYILENVENNEYKITFVDGKGIKNTIRVSQEIYQAFDRFELDDKSLLNENERHIEYSEIYDESLHNRTMDKPDSLEDYIIQKATFEELKKAINCLSDVHKRRIKKYYFEDKNVYQIAAEENISHQAISKSLNSAIQKLKEILEK